MTLRSKYVRAEPIQLKGNAELDEKWVQQIIADEPSILGLGDLVLRDVERNQPRAGRLDLLLQDPDTHRRFEVELQLGPSDESHIVRTIEYWDIERKRYPQYDHCAVIIAEDITSRFLNVISLFNGSIPIVAIQMQALMVDGSIMLVFTKVIDEFTRGLIDEDEDAQAAPTDRDYWERKATKETVGLADGILEILNEIDASLRLKYNKFYIGLEKDGQPLNFVTIRPLKKILNLSVSISRSDEIDAILDEANIETLEYQSKWGKYRLRLTKHEIKSKRETIEKICKLAYEKRTS